MPGSYSSGVGTAFGTMANVFGDAILQKKQQEHQEELDRIKMTTAMVESGLKSGSIENPEQAFQWAMHQWGGGKGKKPKDLPPQLKTIIGGTMQAGQQAGATDQAAPPVFSTPDQVNKRALDFDVNRARRIDTEVTAPMDRRRADLKIEEEKAKPQKGTRDPQPSQDTDGKWTYKVRDTDGTELYKIPGQPPKETGALAERKRELIAQGIPEDRAGAVASLQLEKERGEKQKQASQRVDAYLRLSRQALMTNTERYNEMKESFPFLLAAKVAGADAADARATMADYKAANEGKPDPKKAQATAQKIVEQATKTAATMAGKENSILKGLGFEPDEATIRRNLIQEMSGGQDPDVVEQQAKAATAPVAGGATPPPPKTSDTGDAKLRVEARQYLLQHSMPVTPANIDHYVSESKKLKKAS